jgi:hypothetical protein
VIAKPPELRLIKNRFWLAHRNGRVCAESFVPMTRGNPYRKGSQSWFAFNESYQRRMASIAEEWPIAAAEVRP